MNMDPLQHTILAYIVAIGLMWGYAVTIWWTSRRSITKNKALTSEEVRMQSQ